MKHYSLTLRSPVSTSFRCQKAANSLDIDTAKKSVHQFDVDADLEADYNIGLIVGASGSGKTTLAKQIWGDDVFRTLLRDDVPIIEQFPDEMTYDDCASVLCGVGLTQVPCWIRPVYTLSNGQKARAEVALQIASGVEFSVIDEWTSVVDRTVAKVMSHCVQKYARKASRRIVLCSCHYDVIEWLDPDWVIDCNKQEFIDRRLLQRGQRTERLHFEIRRADRSTWRHFSKYHYLSDQLPGGHIETFGLFHGAEQIAFQCFANYVPWRKDDERGLREKMHSNRTVIHPDYAGFGLGILIINETSRIMVDEGYDVWAKFSSVPVAKSMLKCPDLWQLMNVSRPMRTVIGGKMKRDTGFREKVKTYSFRWVGGGVQPDAARIVA